MGKSKILDSHIKSLTSIRNKSVEAGWFESNLYPDGTSVALVAATQEYGVTINVEAGTRTVYRKINEKSGKFLSKGRFVKKSKSNFSTEHDVGSYKIVIPPRPFMRKAANEISKNIHKLERSLAKKFLDGKINADEMLGKIGIYMVSTIKNSINSDEWTPNAPSTVRKKGFDKPLTDTGILKQTVSFKVL